MARSMHDWRACENNASARLLLHPTKKQWFPPKTVECRQCAATLFSQAPKSCTDLDYIFLYKLILRTFWTCMKVARLNHCLVLDVCCSCTSKCVPRMVTATEITQWLSEEINTFEINRGLSVRIVLTLPLATLKRTSTKVLLQNKF